MVSIRVLLMLVGVTAVTAAKYNITKPTIWWQTSNLYQIWPNSFKDSNGDGIGDLKGITSKLDQLVELGVEIVWLSPFFSSPLVDSGYDISDFRDVNPIYGTLDDFKDLLARAKELGLRVILDFVPNHTSDEHEWFIKSKNGIEPYTDYYVWNEGIIDANGTRQPPNNWLSVFNSGSAWEWVEDRQAYYLHQFSVHQADLNFRNPLVLQETKDILAFWLDMGVDGFRIDSLPYMVENLSLADEPTSGLSGYSPSDYYYLEHPYTKDQPENYQIVREWRDYFDAYTAAKNDGNDRVMFTEAYANISSVMKYYESGSQVAFNFFFIKDDDGVNLVSLDRASDVVDVIDNWMAKMPSGATANWVFGNHDNSRVATRYGSQRVDAINCLLLFLPGIAIIYNGDEIGMTDTYITWEDTTDPQACSTDETRYQFFSRDPERTPYQWDNSTSAGFSTNSTPILPVNENYLTLNLAAQKEADVSHYKNVRAAIELRKTRVVREGSLTVQVIGDQVIALSRELDNEQPIVVLVNWENTTVTVSADVFESVPKQMEVLIADINSGISVGTQYKKRRIQLPGNAAVVLRGVLSRREAFKRPRDKCRQAKAPRRQNTLVFG